MYYEEETEDNNHFDEDSEDNHVEEETIKIVLKTKSFLESLCSPHNCKGLPPTESFDKMINELKLFLRNYCQHCITKDHIDFGFDSTKTIYYCEKCLTTFQTAQELGQILIPASLNNKQLISGSPKDVQSESPIMSQLLNEIEKEIETGIKKGIKHASNSSFDISSHTEREYIGEAEPFSIDTDWQDVLPLTI